MGGLLMSSAQPAASADHLVTTKHNKHAPLLKLKPTHFERPLFCSGNQDHQFDSGPGRQTKLHHHQQAIQCAVLHFVHFLSSFPNFPSNLFLTLVILDSKHEKIILVTTKILSKKGVKTFVKEFVKFLWKKKLSNEFIKKNWSKLLSKKFSKNLSKKSLNLKEPLPSNTE